MSKLHEIASQLVREVYPDKEPAWIKARFLDKWRDERDPARFMNAADVIEVMRLVDVYGDADANIEAALKRCSRAQVEMVPMALMLL